MADVKRLFDSKDMAGAILYAKRVSGDSTDAFPLLSDTNGALLISGSISVAASGTETTINNAVGNPVNVVLTQTVVTVKSAVAGFNVNVATATLGTVTVSLNSTAVTVTNSVSTIAIVGRTLTGSTGSFASTNTTLSVTPAGGNRIKVYAFSLTTTCATELICVFNSGGVANGLELWRDTLMAPAGSSAGANISVAPPNFLFASRAGTAVSLSLNTASLVHWSISYFEEV